MKPNLWLYLLVWAAAGAFGLLLFRRRRRRTADSSPVALAKREEGLPHLCASGTFYVEPSILAKDVSGDGRPHFMHVFEALLCSRCGAELACVSCRSTPESGTLLNAEEMTKLTRCCPAPRYRARKPAKLRVVSSSSGPKGGGDSGNLPN